MTTPRRPARAEVVGSLLRPPKLRAAVEEFYEPGHSAVLSVERAKDRSDLQRLEDDAIGASGSERAEIRAELSRAPDPPTTGAESLEER